MTGQIFFRLSLSAAGRNLKPNDLFIFLSPISFHILIVCIASKKSQAKQLSIRNANNIGNGRDNKDPGQQNTEPGRHRTRAKFTTSSRAAVCLVRGPVLPCLSLADWVQWCDGSELFHALSLATIFPDVSFIRVCIMVVYRYKIHTRVLVSIYKRSVMNGTSRRPCAHSDVTGK